MFVLYFCKLVASVTKTNSFVRVTNCTLLQTRSKSLYADLTHRVKSFIKQLSIAIELSYMQN